jgi:SAM-dependent methyltransferase
MAWFEAQGFEVTGVDRSAEALEVASRYGSTLQADIENAAWPLMAQGQPQRFDVVVVTNYLWRPLFSVIVQSLAPGGLLLYETFSQGNETIGKPARPEFLLNEGELLQLCQGLHVVAYEDGFLSAPERFVQRIAAIQVVNHRRENPMPPRYTLSLK